VKLVVGLGNPGPRYARTRHNAGRRVAQRFAERLGIGLGGERFGGRFGLGRLGLDAGGALEVAVLLPDTFMNLSGDAVAQALGELPVGDPGRDLLVVLDDVDLPFGRLRLRAGGGAGGHRGLAHVIERLGRADVPRLRFGVGRPPGPLGTTQHVLAPFSEEEERALPERIEAAARAVELALARGVEAAARLANREPAPADGPGEPPPAQPRDGGRAPRLSGSIFEGILRIFRK
jgi:PTH1 family peptidyl-tRNA hydrolase